MKNYIQQGNTLTLAAPAAVDAGTLVTIGDIVGVAANDAGIGETLDLATVGVFELPKDDTIALLVGAKAFFDGDKIAEESSASSLIGVVVATSQVGESTARVKLG